MIDKRRVLYNLFASYGRTMLAVVVGLFSVRLVLSALGAVDYGLNNVVGAIISFVAYFNATVSNAVSRYYAYSIGLDESAETDAPTICAWFNTALFLHIVMGFVLAISAWLVGEIAIRQYLNIPAERMSACLLVLRFSIVALFLNCMSAPYCAMFYAKQNIVELSIYGVCTTLCTGFIAFSLSFFRSDKLVVYSFLTVLSHSVIVIIQIIRARMIFSDECRISCDLWFSFARLKDLIGFIGLNMFRAIGELIRGHGSAFLINVGWNPTVNAAYAIGNQVSIQSASLSSALQNALSPAVITEAGAGRADDVYRLVLKMEWACTLLILIFAVPLSFEINYVLALWLKNPPSYTNVFCVTMLAMLVLERLAAGHCIVLESYKKLYPYNVFEGVSAILVLPALYFCYKVGLGAGSVGICFVVLAVAKVLMRVYFVRRQIGFSVAKWFFYVLIPVGGIAVATAVACYFVHSFMAFSMGRLIASSFVSACVCGGLTFCIMLNPTEKAKLNNLLKRRLGRC